MLNEYQQKDLAIITDPTEWGSMVFAMVKRSAVVGESLQCAFLVKGHGPKLYLKNLFELEGGLLSPQLVGVPTTKFETFEAMLEDGWEAD
jgi:hypothetical protein